MPHAENQAMTEPVINGEKVHSQFLDVSHMFSFLFFFLLYSLSVFLLMQETDG